MERTTLMLPDELRRQAIRQAQAMGLSFGELIRRSLKDFLARPKTRSRERDPLFADSGIYEGDVPKDLSLDHDKYLYGEEP